MGISECLWAVRKEKKPWLERKTCEQCEHVFILEDCPTTCETYRKWRSEGGWKEKNPADSSEEAERVNIRRDIGYED